MFDYCIYFQFVCLFVCLCLFVFCCLHKLPGLSLNFSRFFCLCLFFVSTFLPPPIPRAALPRCHVQDGCFIISLWYRSFVFTCQWPIAFSFPFFFFANVPTSVCHYSLSYNPSCHTILLVIHFRQVIEKAV